MIIIPIKWLFHWEYTVFSDKPQIGAEPWLWNCWNSVAICGHAMPCPSTGLWETPSTLVSGGKKYQTAHLTWFPRCHTAPWHEGCWPPHRPRPILNSRWVSWWILMILNVCLAWTGFVLSTLFCALSFTEFQSRGVTFKRHVLCPMHRKGFRILWRGKDVFENSKVHQLKRWPSQNAVVIRNLKSDLQRAIAHHLECSAGCFRRKWVELPKKII